MTCGRFGAVRQSTTRMVMAKAKAISKMSRCLSAGTRARAMRGLCQGLAQQGPVQQTQASTASSHAKYPLPEQPDMESSCCGLRLVQANNHQHSNATRPEKLCSRLQALTQISQWQAVKQAAQQCAPSGARASSSSSAAARRIVICAVTLASSST